MGGTRTNNYILFAISFLAAIWFFVGYSSQDLRSAAEVNFTKDEVKLKAARQLSDIGFSIDDYTLTDVRYSKHTRLLDSLQHRLGRRQAIEKISNSNYTTLKPFFWDVTFTKNKTIGNNSNTGDPFAADPSELRIRFDVSGNFIALINPSDHLPGTRVQREALGAVFTAGPDSLEPGLMAGVSDSLIDRMMYFDLQKKDGAYANYTRKPVRQVLRDFDRGIPYRHSPNDAHSMANHYLSKTGWERSAFEVDSFFVQRMGSVNALNVRYGNRMQSLGQQTRLDVVVAPTGALLAVNAAYNVDENNGSSIPIWGYVHTILLFMLGLTGLIVFFFRMRARAIDTQSALVAAVIMGLVIPISYFLQQVNAVHPFAESASFNDSLILFLQMGIYGALSSVGFFVLFSVSDSITRQHWPHKLSSYDYLRQGMIFNKPIGTVVVRSIALAFVLAGGWTLLIYLFPHVSIAFQSVFISEEAAWPFLYLLLQNAWFSFSIILAVFLVIGGLSYGQSKSKWVAAFFIILASGILVPVLYSFNPPIFDLLMGILLGAGLAMIYIKWDFLTLLFSHFLFLGLLQTTTGWTIANSPDGYLFIFYIVFLVILFIAGALAVVKGKEQRSLPEYVPGYVEELAQEERIKQELQIARRVQQSFLPSNIPVLPGLDMAAICEPAYETGGDYYDFIPLDDHRVAVAIGDVSGKGIEAAFYMTFVKGMLHSLCRESDSPAEVLRKANRLFYDNAARGTFVSLVYGIIDLNEHTFTFARAGHNPILHINRSTGTIEELRPNGLGIGLTKQEVFDNKIREVQLSITDDDLFLLYTDGIVEALNHAHEFYGSERLEKLIQKHKDKPASKLVSLISKEVSRYIGQAKQHDDMTLLSIRFGHTQR
jgi:hypothetical protein